MVIPCSAEAELALRRAAEKQLIDYKPGDCNFKITQPEKLSPGQIKALEAIREKVLQKKGSTGIQDAMNMAYFKLLNMITVYPVEDLEHLSDHNGRVLPDAYLIPKGTTAHQFAYLIHTELGESFIYAIDARDKRRIGEDAILKDRDVISIVSAKKTCLTFFLTYFNALTLDWLPIRFMMTLNRRFKRKFSLSSVNKVLANFYF